MLRIRRLVLQLEQLDGDGVRVGYLAAALVMAKFYMRSMAAFPRAGTYWIVLLRQSQDCDGLATEFGANLTPADI